jgi:regulator of protease activity HflC (stomatin/prohibitin superfamily)
MASQSTVISDILDMCLNEVELRMVCFDLGIDYALLAGASKTARCQILVKFCETGFILGQLESVIKAHRPDIPLSTLASAQNSRVKVEFFVRADILKFAAPNQTEMLVKSIASCFHVPKDDIHVLLVGSDGKSTTRLVLGMARPVAEGLVVSFARRRGKAYHILNSGLNVQSVRISEQPPGLWQKPAAWQHLRLRGAMRLALYLSIFLFLLLAARTLVLWRYPEGGPKVLLSAVLAALPGLVTWCALPLIGARFMQRIHGIDGWQVNLRYLSLCVFGSLLRSNPYIFVQEGKVKIPESQTRLLPQGKPMSPGPGGPCKLVVFSDSAVVLERAGRYTDVVLPSVYDIGRFERIQQIIDLRPQSHESEARVMTRDGIPLNVKVRATYHICWRGEPTIGRPYPVDPDAVFRAAESLGVFRTKDGKPQLRTWADRIGSMLDSELRTLIARYRLDELFEPREDQLQPRAQLQYAYGEALRRMAGRFGAEITEVWMGTFEFEGEEIKERFIEVWGAEWAIRARLSLLHADADVIRVREQARAFAQFEMVQELTREFKPLAGDTSIPVSLITLRFIEVIQRMAANPEGGIFLPREALATLDGVRKMLEDDQGPAVPPGSSGADQSGAGQ